MSEPGPLSTSPVGVLDRDTDDVTSSDQPWVVLVWNDPVNMISYVCAVLQKVFALPYDKAMQYTMQVHNDGKSVVSNGSKEKCEMDVFRLHQHGLWATMQHDGSSK